MPYSKKSKFEHHRKKSPGRFVKTSFRNVPISHVPHKKKYPKGTRAIVGKLKKPKKGQRKYQTQSILIPKKR